MKVKKHHVLTCLFLLLVFLTYVVPVFSFNHTDVESLLNELDIPQLNQLTRDIADNNYDVKKAKLEVCEAKNNARLQASKFFPSLGIEAGNSLRLVDSNKDGKNSNQNNWEHTVGLNAGLDFKVNHCHEFGAAEHEIRAAIAKCNALIDEKCQNSIELYLELACLIEKSSILHRTSKSVKSLLECVRKGYRLSIYTPETLDELEAIFFENEIKNNALRLAITDNIRKLSLVTPCIDLNLVEFTLPKGNFNLLLNKESFSKIVETRHDIRALQEEYRAIEKRMIGSSASGIVPKISFKVGAVLKSDKFSELTDNDNFSLNIGMGVEHSLFGGGAKQSETLILKDRMLKKNEEYCDARKKALLELGKIYDTYDNTVSHTNTLKNRVEYLSKKLELEKKLFSLHNHDHKNILRTLIESLNANFELIESRKNLIVNFAKYKWLSKEFVALSENSS